MLAHTDWTSICGHYISCRLYIAIMPSIEITCPVYPSEDPEKVKTAILKVFPNATLEESDMGIRGTTEDLDRFSKQIRKQKILDTTRSVMLHGKRGDRTRIFLNKQVAFVGKVSFCEEKTILGTMKVVIIDEDIDGLIDKVAPVTVDGEEVIL